MEFEKLQGIIAEVLNVSYDTLLNEKVDLSDKTQLNVALKNLDNETKGKVNNSFRYRIREYTITKKDYIKEKFKQKASEFLREKEYEFALHAKTLEKSDINSILNKGFAYLEKEGNSVGLKDLNVDDVFETVVKDGKIKSKVLKLEER